MVGSSGEKPVASSSAPSSAGSVSANSVAPLPHASHAMALGPDRLIRAVTGPLRIRLVRQMAPSACDQVTRVAATAAQRRQREAGARGPRKLHAAFRLLSDSDDVIVTSIPIRLRSTGGMDRTKIGWRLLPVDLGRGGGCASTVGCSHPRSILRRRSPARSTGSSRSGGATSARRCWTPSTSSSPTGARSTCAARASTSPPTCWSDSSAAANACARPSCFSAGCAARSRPTPALRAAASLELLHAFALLQDDVMDGSPLRRGRASAHVQFAAGTATVGCPAARSGSANRRRSCSAICAWSGPNRCCGTAASTTAR